MKLHEFAGAPNPKKVRVYLAEKGIERADSSRSNIISGREPPARVPQEEPDGRSARARARRRHYLPESLAIIEYFEELHPNPPMIGTTPLERARVRALERLCELGVLGRIAVIFQNTHPLFAGRVKQSRRRRRDGARRARHQPRKSSTPRSARTRSSPVTSRRSPTARCSRRCSSPSSPQIPIDPASRTCTAGTRASSSGRAPRPEREPPCPPSTSPATARCSCSR